MGVKMAKAILGFWAGMFFLGLPISMTLTFDGGWWAFVWVAVAICAVVALWSLVWALSEVFSELDRGY